MKGVHILSRPLYKSKLYLKRSTPTILSIIGSAGVIATAVLAVKATPKALDCIRHDSRINHDGNPYEYTKLEAFKSAWKCYIPSVTIGIGTIMCIFGSNALNKRQQAAMTSAYMLLDNAYKDYKKKTTELFGNDSDTLVKSAIARDKIVNDTIPDLGEKCLFYEYNYGEYFERSKEEVLNAEYKFNLKFSSRGYANLNDFYELLDLPKTDFGEILGWIFCDELYGSSWIDFKHELLELEDGMECYIIDMPISPIIGYMDFSSQK